MKHITKAVEEKVIRFVEERGLLEKGDKILTALSGGPDSVFLLHFFIKFKNKYQVELSAIHINHKLRGKQADKDEKFCKKLCNELGIKLFTSSFDVKKISKQKKISIEEAGREVRYAEFQKVLSEINFNKIATAHNKTDNTETVFLNLIKGAGLKGLSGIPFRRQNIIRPILCLTKDEIVQYLKENKINYRVDESNTDTNFQRNFLREKILPKIRKKLNSNLDTSVSNLSAIAWDLQKYIEDNILNALKGKVVSFENDELYIDLDAVNDENTPDFLFGELLRRIVAKYFELEIEFSDVKSCLSLLNNNTGTEIDLGKNVLAVRERNFIVIRKVIQQTFKKKNLRAGDSIKIDDKTFSIKAVDKNEIKFSDDKNIEYISGDNLNKTFNLRRWANGDKFYPLGMTDQKKLSDFINEAKIPSYKKKEQLVLINNNKIIWVVGLRINDQVKITDDSKVILKLSFK